MKIRMGKGKSFGNAAVISRLAILRGGRRNAKRMEIGGMQVIVLVVEANYSSRLLRVRSTLLLATNSTTVVGYLLTS
jgi:hypothetical protein